MINSYYSERWKLTSFSNFQPFQFKIRYNDNNNKNNIDGAFVLRIICIHSSIFFFYPAKQFLLHILYSKDSPHLPCLFVTLLLSSGSWFLKLACFFLENHEDSKRLLKQMKMDERRWKAADLDHDGKLSKAEFAAFNQPWEYDYMHVVAAQENLEDMDKDMDGKISLQEFLGTKIYSFAF